MRPSHVEVYGQMLTLRLAAAMSVVVSTALLVPRAASANTAIDYTLEDPFTGILTLIFANVTMDLFLISFAIYVAFLATKKGLGDITRDTKSFIALIAMASVGVAVAGGVIDFAFLYEPVDNHYELRDLSAEIVIPATALILVSIAVMLRVTVRIRPCICLVIGTVVALLSPVSWFLTLFAISSPYAFHYIGLVATTGCFAGGVLVALYFIHRNVYSGRDDMAYEGA